VAAGAGSRRQKVRAGIAIVVLGWLAGLPGAVAQDIRGLEICTAEKDMARRTSCLQSNVELLQQELTRQSRRAQKAIDDDRAAAARDIAVLKADVATLRAALEKTQSELAEMKKALPPQKK
jgi:septal ring factor EnvC (AmiA/AmiB activator)